MTKQNTALHLKEIVGLLNNQQFIKRARGSEAPAVAQVRMALKRLRDEQDDSKNIITDPQKTDKLGLAITMLLRELPASASAPHDLKAIRDKAVALGNLLLPAESPA